METIYLAVKLIAAVWICVTFLLFSLGGNASEEHDRFSSYVLFGTMSAFLPALQFGLTHGPGEAGFISSAFPYVSAGGFLLLLAGVCIHAAGILTLKKQWSTSVVLVKDHELIHDGIYRLVRHPIYLGVFLELAGFGLAVANWISLAVLLLPNLVGFAYRIHVEEKALAKHFGPAYTAYSKHTKRLIPWVF